MARSETDDLEKVAAAFDRDTDPLAQYEPQFEQIDVDPLEAYLDRVKIPNGASESTLRNYRYSFDQWQTFMATVDRHYACPSDAHVKQFVEYLETERGNRGPTILKKVRNLNRVYEWWQEHHAFPHPTDYDPFRIAIRELDIDEQGEQRKHPPLTVDDLSDVIADCTNVRERLFLVLQLKLGLRVGELLNIRFEDIALSHSEANNWYPELGANDRIQDYENAIHIPQRSEREGNKSRRPRILPLDDETRRVLLQYLPTRPMVDRPWLILSQRNYEKLGRGDRVNQVWRECFSDFNEDEQYRDITSHYGRYFFTNHWKVQKGVARELVQYMRGDKLGDTSGQAIDEYLTAHYENIRHAYLDQVFKIL